MGPCQYYIPASNTGPDSGSPTSFEAYGEFGSYQSVAGRKLFKEEHGFVHSEGSKKSRVPPVEKSLTDFKFEINLSASVDLLVNSSSRVAEGFGPQKPRQPVVSTCRNNAQVPIPTGAGVPEKMRRVHARFAASSQVMGRGFLLPARAQMGRTTNGPNAAKKL
jgi:hypothetical protein